MPLLERSSYRNTEWKGNMLGALSKRLRLSIGPAGPCVIRPACNEQVMTKANGKTVLKPCLERNGKAWHEALKDSAMALSQKKTQRKHQTSLTESTF